MVIDCRSEHCFFIQVRCRRTGIMLDYDGRFAEVLPRTHVTDAGPSQTDPLPLSDPALNQWLLSRLPWSLDEVVSNSSLIEGRVQLRPHGFGCPVYDVLIFFQEEAVFPKFSLKYNFS